MEKLFIPDKTNKITITQAHFNYTALIQTPVKSSL